MQICSPFTNDVGIGVILPNLSGRSWCFANARCNVVFLVRGSDIKHGSVSQEHCSANIDGT